VANGVLDEAWLQVRVLDDEQLVGPLQQVVDRRAHRALRDVDEELCVEVLLGSHEKGLAAALVVGRDRDEIEDPVDVRLIEAGIEESLGRPVADEPLRARARVDPGRLDAHRTPRSGLGRRGDPAERHHLLRREAGDRRAPVDRPLGANPDLGLHCPLPLDHALRDEFGQDLDEHCLPLDDQLDRILEELGEARHVDAFLIGGEVDGAVDRRGHDGLRVPATDAYCLLHTGDARPREGERDLRRRRLEVLIEPDDVGHPGHRSTVLQRNSRESLRSFSSRPPVWQLGQ
jgi:hypothetical protein